MSELYLTSWSKITSSGFWKDGEPLMRFNPGDEASSTLKTAYKKLELSYPKFFKMDGLSKLGILASEVLLTDEVKSQYTDDEIAIVLSNSQSSLQSDTEHCEQYMSGTASPAIFVYTLPNIAIGEICIRQKLHGESNFYIYESFNAKSLMEQASLLVNASSTRACIVGWLEYYNNDFEASFYLLEKQGTQRATSKLLDTIKDTPY